MSAKSYKAPDTSYVATNTDILEDFPHRRAREELLPRIAKKAHNATNVIPIWVEFFQRLKSGRRCSCWSVEEDPKGLCKVCFGTGIVGAYNKRGTKTEVIDVTYPNVAAVNVEIDYAQPTRPINWTLNDTAVFGSLEFSLPITQNVGILDVLQINDYQPEGTIILYCIKTPLEATFVELTEESLQSRLHNDTIQFKIVMKRRTPAAPLPKLQNIRICYKLLRITAVKADIPRITESLTLEEFGIYESWTTSHYYLDNTIKNITTEDFLINLMDGTRWKIIDVSDNKPLGILTSWDITCRKVQQFDNYTAVPAGVLDTSLLPPDYIRSSQTDAELLGQHKDTTTIGDRKPGHRTFTTVVYSDADGTGVPNPTKEE
jgi:hypothetical protein